MGLPLILALSLGFAGCGGSTVVISGDGGGDGSGGTDGGQGEGAAPDGGATSCDALSAQIASAKAAAQACCPTCDSLQCAGVAQDLCCQVSVQNADKGQQLTALVVQFKAACHVACPAMPCPKVPSNRCDPSRSLCQ